MERRTKASPAALQQPESRGCTAASIHTAVNNNTPQRTADSAASTLPRVSPCVCVCSETEGGGVCETKRQDWLSRGLQTLYMYVSESKVEAHLHLPATVIPQVWFTKVSSAVKLAIRERIQFVLNNQPQCNLIIMSDTQPTRLIWVEQKKCP